MRYVDGFVLPVKKKNLPAYRRLAKAFSRFIRKHGALEYVEAVGDDLKTKWCAPFPRVYKTKAGETVVFAYIVYKSRAHRDKVNAALMKDPRMKKMCDPSKMPFDMKRMSMGGFKMIVDV